MKTPLIRVNQPDLPGEPLMEEGEGLLEAVLGGVPAHAQQPHEAGLGLPDLHQEHEAPADVEIVGADGAQDPELTMRQSSLHDAARPDFPAEHVIARETPPS